MTRNDLTRRDFMRATTAFAGLAPATGLLAAGPSSRATAGPIRVGLVGAGGRGTGACANCLAASDHVRIIAMGDVFAHKCRSARQHLLEDHGNRIDVPDARIFEGLEAAAKVIHHPDVDLVILTTPPGFRAEHLAAVVEAGKHAFVEKPVCVDATGYRSCLASGRVARAKGLSIVTGTQFRRQPSYLEAIRRVHDGAIGTVLSGISCYCVTGIWNRPREDNMTDVEHQCNNWYHHLWLCGDQIVEQAVHNLDAVNWTMGGPPVKAYGSGGQMTRPSGSEIWDHMSIDFEYPGGANISFKCRQIPGSHSRVINTFTGTKGTAFINPGGSRIVAHDGTVLFDHPGRGNDPYVHEHVELVASIHGGGHWCGNPIMEIDEVADSSLTAVLGRTATYTGQEVTWDFMHDESVLDLMPPNLTLESTLPERTVPVPGREPLV